MQEANTNGVTRSCIFWFKRKWMKTSKRQMQWILSLDISTNVHLTLLFTFCTDYCPSLNLQNDQNSPFLGPSKSESAFIFKTNVIIHRSSAWLYDDFQLLLTFFWIQIYKLEPDAHAFSPGCPVLTRNNSQFRSCFSPFYNSSGEVQDLHFRLLIKFQGKRTMRYANVR